MLGKECALSSEPGIIVPSISPEKAYHVLTGETVFTSTIDRVSCHKRCRREVVLAGLGIAGWTLLVGTVPVVCCWPVHCRLDAAGRCIAGRVPRRLWARFEGANEGGFLAVAVLLSLRRFSIASQIVCFLMTEASLPRKPRENFLQMGVNVRVCVDFWFAARLQCKGSLSKAPYM